MTRSPADPAESNTLLCRSSRVGSWGINLLILAILAGFWPLSSFLDRNLQDYLLHVIILVGIYITLATSLNLINGVTGQFSLGHAGFMAVGGYACGMLSKHYIGHVQTASATMGYVGTLVAGGIIAAAAGLLIGIPSLRLRGDYLAIATLGFGEIIRVVINQTSHIGPLEVGGASGLHDIPIRANFFWTYAVALICVVCMWRIVHSVRGKNFLAVREDEIAAAASGVNTTYIKVLAFVIGAFFAGVAGGLQASSDGNLAPQFFNFMLSVEIVAMVVLGGSGSITGVILAAVVLTILPEVLRPLQGPWRMILYSLLLILTMLLRPEGLLGRRELWWTKQTLPEAAGPAET